MILECLRERQKEMQSVYSLEQAKKDKETQAKVNTMLDLKLAICINYLKTLSLLKTKLSYTLKSDTKVEFLDTIAQIKAIAASGYPTMDEIKTITASLKISEDKIKKEWADFYKKKTASPLRILQIAGDFDPERCKHLEEDIKGCDTWQDSQGCFNRFIKALSESEEVIRNMDADEDVLHFLTKIHAGKATIADLTPGILSWLNEHQLSNKVQLGFIR